MERPTCSTCHAYDPVATSLIYPPNPGNYCVIQYPVEAKGICRRSHDAQPHRGPDDWCCEHQCWKGWIDHLNGLRGEPEQRP